MSDGEPVLGSLFVYAPNKIAPVVFAVAFAVSAVGHVWQCYHYKSFKLIGLHPLCAVIFTVGYALREYGSFNYIYSRQNLIFFITSQVCIYICPPLLELANYHVLGRMLRYVPHLAPLPPKKVSSIFGGLLALVELLNSLGVSLSANTSASSARQELGSRLTIAALGIQLGVIVIFALIAAVFHWRCVRADIHAKAVSTPMTTLYISTALILVRCVFRLVEHFGNTTVNLRNLEALKNLSPVLRYEWFFYVFEATLMLLNSALWNVWNPGRYMPGNSRLYLAPDGRTELMAEPEPKKSLLVKVGTVASFGLLGLCLRGEKPNQHENGPGLQLDDVSDKKPLIVKVGSVVSFGLLGLFLRKREDRGEELREYGAAHH